MAIVVNISCMFSEILDITSFFQELKYNGIDAGIEKMLSIDTWLWENRQEYQSYSEIEKLLQDSKILVVNAYVHPFKDFGVYIEKIKKKYIYSFWINTEGYPELDTDIINIQNRYFFDRVQEVIKSILKKYESIFDLLSISNETTLQYDGNILDTIHGTDSIIMWMINKKLGMDIYLEGYCKKIMDDVDIEVYEKE